MQTSPPIDGVHQGELTRHIDLTCSDAVGYRAFLLYLRTCATASSPPYCLCKEQPVGLGGLLRISLGGQKPTTPCLAAVVHVGRHPESTVLLSDTMPASQAHCGPLRHKVHPHVEPAGPPTTFSTRNSQRGRTKVLGLPNLLTASGA